jgi:hypothetical protein
LEWTNQIFNSACWRIRWAQIHFIWWYGQDPSWCFRRTLHSGNLLFQMHLEFKCMVNYDDWHRHRTQHWHICVDTDKNELIEHSHMCHCRTPNMPSMRSVGATKVGTIGEYMAPIFSSPNCCSNLIDCINCWLSLHTVDRPLSLYGLLEYP